jgi:hypothetical protein
MRLPATVLQWEVKQHADKGSRCWFPDSTGLDSKEDFSMYPVSVIAQKSNAQSLSSLHPTWRCECLPSKAQASNDMQYKAVITHFHFPI